MQLVFETTKFIVKNPRNANLFEDVFSKWSLSWNITILETVYLKREGS